MVSVDGNNDPNKRAILSYSPPPYSEAEDDGKDKKANYESDDEGNKKKAAVEDPFDPEEEEPKLKENFGFHTEVGAEMPDLDLSVAPSSRTGLFIIYMLTMKLSPQKFTVDTVNWFQDELLETIQSDLQCLFG